MYGSQVSVYTGGNLHLMASKALSAVMSPEEAAQTASYLKETQMYDNTALEVIEARQKLGSSLVTLLGPDLDRQIAAEKRVSTKRKALAAIDATYVKVRKAFAELSESFEV